MPPSIIAESTLHLLELADMTLFYCFQDSENRARSASGVIAVSQSNDILLFAHNLEHHFTRS